MLERAYSELALIGQFSEKKTELTLVDPRAKMLVTFIFLVMILSLPVENLPDLLPFFIYPLVVCHVGMIPLDYVIKRSCLVLPFLFCIGIFNPFYDRTIAFEWEGVIINNGVISLITLMIRGLLAVQASLLLICTTSFQEICRGAQKLGLPTVVVTQFLLMYRYIFVLLEETISSKRAVLSRAGGRSSLNFKEWALVVGHLLMRSFERSERIFSAMLVRGYEGKMQGLKPLKWQDSSSVYLFSWATVLVAMRVFAPASFLGHLIM